MPRANNLSQNGGHSIYYGFIYRIAKSPFGVRTLRVATQDRKPQYVRAMVFLFLIYIFCFLSLAFLKNWRLLTLGGFISLAISAYIFHSISSSDSRLSFIFLPGFLAISLGFIAGFVGRSAVLLFNRFEPRAITSLIVLFVSFIGVPLSAYYLIDWHSSRQKARREAARVPPSAACTDRLHAATIGDVHLALPLAPAFRVGMGYDFNPSYILGFKKAAREFCKLTEDSTPHLTNLNIEISYHGPPYGYYETSSFCTESKAYDWWELICRRKDSKSEFGNLRKITVYVIDKYNIGYSYVSTKYKSGKKQSKVTGIPEIKINYIVSKYILDEYLYFKRSDIKDYLAECYKMNPRIGKNSLYCQAGHPLTDTLGLAYDFVVEEDRFPEVSKVVDDKAIAIFNSLKRQ